MPCVCKRVALEHERAQGTRLGGAQLGGQDAAEAGATAELQHAPRRDQLRMLRQLPAFPCASLKLKPAWRVSGYCRQGQDYYKNACQLSTVGNIYQAQLFYAAMCVTSVVWNFALRVKTSAQAMCGAPCQGTRAQDLAFRSTAQAGVAHQHRQCAARHTRVPSPSLRAPCRTVMRTLPYSGCCSCARTGLVRQKVSGKG